MIESKSDIISEKYRNIGNNLFNSGKILFSLIAYNKAICFAKSKEVLALAYANRSAVYLEDGKYDECLQNIKLARDDYPKGRIEKLNEREAKCKKLKKENADKPSIVPDKFFKLSYPPNEKVPFVVNRLENRNGNLFATADLKPGDIIAIEESVVKFLPRYGYVDRCYNCLKVNNMNLLPCLKSASLMFCSNECRNQPYDITDEPDIAGVKKVVREALDVFGSNGFKKEIYKGGNRWILYKSPTFFDFDLSKNNPDRLKHWWSCIFNYNNVLGFVNPDNIAFPPIFGNNNVLNTFHDSFKFSTSVWMRCQEFKDDKQPIYTQQFLSMYGLYRMIPHSCFYNIEYFRHNGSTLVLYVTKPIKAGEQLFRNHLNGDCTEFTKETRKSDLLSAGEICQCFICKFDIRTSDLHDGNTKLATRALKKLASKGMTVKEILDDLTANWKRISQIHENQMSKEIHILMAANNELMELLSMKKNYITKGRCCINPSCAAEQIQI